jgi:hypothetical protein
LPCHDRVPDLVDGNTLALAVARVHLGANR